MFERECGVEVGGGSEDLGTHRRAALMQLSGAAHGCSVSGDCSAARDISQKCVIRILSLERDFVSKI